MDQPLGLGVEEAKVPSPYFRLDYDTPFKVINLQGDLLTNLQPPSAPNVLACVNQPITGDNQNSSNCLFAIGGTSSNYGVTPLGFSFACSSELLGDPDEPEAIQCEIKTYCRSSTLNRPDLSVTSSFVPSGPTDVFKSVTTGATLDDYYYACCFVVVSAGDPDSVIPFEGDVSILVDNFQYLFRKLPPPPSSSPAPPAKASATPKAS